MMWIILFHVRQSGKNPLFTCHQHDRLAAHFTCVVFMFSNNWFVLMRFVFFGNFHRKLVDRQRHRTQSKHDCDRRPISTRRKVCKQTKKHPSLAENITVQFDCLFFLVFFISFIKTGEYRLDLWQWEHWMDLHKKLIWRWQVENKEKEDHFGVRSKIASIENVYTRDDDWQWTSLKIYEKFVEFFLAHLTLASDLCPSITNNFVFRHNFKCSVWI